MSKTFLYRIGQFIKYLLLGILSCIMVFCFYMTYFVSDEAKYPAAFFLCGTLVVIVIAFDAALKKLLTARTSSIPHEKWPLDLIPYVPTDIFQQMDYTYQDFLSRNLITDEENQSLSYLRMVCFPHGSFNAAMQICYAMELDRILIRNKKATKFAKHFAKPASQALTDGASDSSIFTATWVHGQIHDFIQNQNLIGMDINRLSESLSLLEWFYKRIKKVPEKKVICNPSLGTFDDSFKIFVAGFCCSLEKNSWLSKELPNGDYAVSTELYMEYESSLISLDELFHRTFPEPYRFRRIYSRAKYVFALLLPKYEEDLFTLFFAGQTLQDHVHRISELKEKEKCKAEIKVEKKKVETSEKLRNKVLRTLIEKNTGMFRGEAFSMLCNKYHFLEERYRESNDIPEGKNLLLEDSQWIDPGFASYLSTSYVGILSTLPEEKKSSPAKGASSYSKTRRSYDSGYGSDYGPSGDYTSSSSSGDWFKPVSFYDSFGFFPDDC